MGRRAERAIASFKVYPKGGYYYFKVNVWKNKREMHRHLKKICVPYSRNTQGICSSFRVIRKGNLLPILGEVNLHNGYLGGGVVVHEFTHAAFAYCRQKKINIMAETDDQNVSDQEEEFCYALHQMCRQTFNQLFKRKIWK